MLQDIVKTHSRGGDPNPDGLVVGAGGDERPIVVWLDHSHPFSVPRECLDAVAAGEEEEGAEK